MGDRSGSGSYQIQDSRSPGQRWQCCKLVWFSAIRSLSKSLSTFMGVQTQDENEEDLSHIPSPWLELDACYHSKQSGYVQLAPNSQIRFFLLSLCNHGRAKSTSPETPGPCPQTTSLSEVCVCIRQHWWQVVYVAANRANRPCAAVISLPELDVHQSWWHQKWAPAPMSRWHRNCSSKTS